MAINKITNTPVIVNSYNSRSITCNNSVAKNCAVLPDGTLYILVGDWSGKILLYRSINNGFSWTQLRDSVETQLNMREVAGLTQDGLCAHVVLNERYDFLDVYMGHVSTVPDPDEYALDRSRYSDLSDIPGATPSSSTVLDTTDNPHQAWVDVCYNNEQIFMVWVDTSPGDLNVTRASPRTTSISSEDSKGDSSLFNLLYSVCDSDGNVYIVYQALVSSERILYFTKYTSSDGNFTSEVEIENFGTSPEIGKDITLARDEHGTLCVAYYSQNQEDVKYAVSTDDGATWDVNTITPTSGHSAMTDSITSDSVGRTNIIGGKGGFIISYVRDTGSNNRCFVRQLTTSDSGTTYSLQEEREVATKDPYSGKDVVGVQFFHPTDVNLLDLSDPGKVRIAFTVGEGDSTTMADTKGVTVGQELLSESAYPSSLDSEDGSYSTDTADDISLLVRFATVAGPNSNIDFYEAGFTGPFTDRYLNAFNEIGTSCRLLRFDPDADNDMNDNTAYGAPTEFETNVLFDPVTYSFPSPALNAETIDERIEVDVRKLHVPPDFHLKRDFIVNTGGYLKRTVWLIEYDGNQYEISQVIPRFFNNQICFYECNGYVVGPSRDPFARTVLPSET